MKIYAKVSSERASKGQGGNKYIDIELHAFNHVDIVGRVLLQIKADKEGKQSLYTIVFQDPEDPEKTIVLKEGHEIDGTIKTATKESESEKCEICGAELYGLIRVHHHTK